jgi:hypothetical protein
LHVTAAYFVLIALIFYGCTRFAVPIAPCLCLFAAEGLRAARSTQHAARAGARRLGERLASPFVGLRAACCVLRAGAKRHA